ncbi:DUF4228 domain-containing protein [Heracleum sosnowskyi]|uniref:DUF4228 domain-containing protein n=1 Tax=Heracleum sosnowskyi TaxID=360622 RepID=A0AAD8HBX5_9APIA|nr:DUF4228 domain-containing protein [Heracleum sosnowskyi]
MGNCQAAEAATVVIQHPTNNKVQRIYSSVSAHQVMSSNPGHYVALVISPSTVFTENGTPVKQLKILRPHDMLLIGKVYRLVSFQDVFKELASKKCVKLEKLLKERGMELLRKGLLPPTTSNDTSLEKAEEEQVGGIGRKMRVVNGRNHQHQGNGTGQWKPALQSIAELGV